MLSSPNYRFFLSESEMNRCQYDCQKGNAYENENPLNKLRQKFCLKIYQYSAKQVIEKVHNHGHKDTIISVCQISQQQPEEKRIDSLSKIHMVNSKEYRLYQICHKKSCSRFSKIL